MPWLGAARSVPSPLAMPAFGQSDSRRRNAWPTAVSALLAVLLAHTAGSEDWPQFLGPRRDGSARDAGLLRAWLERGLDVRWRRPIGEGYSGLAVAGGLVVTMDSRSDDEFALALEATNGVERWRVRTGRSPRDVYGGLGPRVTPSLHEGRVYLVSAEGLALCLDAGTGRELWRRDLLRDLGFRPPAEGAGSSPLVAEGRVYVLVGGTGGRLAAALDAQTGRTLWTGGDDRTSYSSPVRAELGGRAQVLLLAGTRLVSLEATTGRPLFEHPWPTEDYVNAATPLALSEGRVFLSSGNGRGAAMLRVTARGEGLSATELWFAPRFRNHFNNAVAVDGLLLGFDGAFLKAVDALVGRELWAERGFGEGSLVSLLGEDSTHLVVLSDDGELALARAGTSGLRVHARQRVLEGRSWTPPTIADGVVFLRNAREAVALGPAGLR